MTKTLFHHFGLHNNAFKYEFELANMWTTSRDKVDANVDPNVWESHGNNGFCAPKPGMVGNGETWFDIPLYKMDMERRRQGKQNSERQIQMSFFQITITP